MKKISNVQLSVIATIISLSVVIVQHIACTQFAICVCDIEKMTPFWLSGMIFVIVTAVAYFESETNE